MVWHFDARHGCRRNAAAIDWEHVLILFAEFPDERHCDLLVSKHSRFS